MITHQSPTPDTGPTDRSNNKIHNHNKPSQDVAIVTTSKGKILDHETTVALRHDVESLVRLSSALFLEDIGTRDPLTDAG
jgi:hypothetical protein